MRYKTKKKTIVLVLVSILLFIGLFGVIKVIGKLDFSKQKISATSFSIGGLNATGEYKDTEESIYTKELIGCMGLLVEPEFDSQCTYQVYFYDKDENFIESTAQTKEKYENSVPLAKYCRIVIYPQNDKEINFTEVIKYASKVSIKVDKEQNFIYETNLYTRNISMTGKHYVVNSDNTLGTEDYSVDGEVVQNSIEIDRENISKLHIVVKNDAYFKQVNLIMKKSTNYVSNRYLILSGEETTLYKDFVVELSTDIVSFVISYYTTSGDNAFIEVYGE